MAFMAAALVLGTSAFAYDMRNEQLVNEETKQALAQLETEIWACLDRMNATYFSQSSTQGEIDFTSAVMVYTFEPEAFLDGVQKGTLFLERNTAGTVGWRIPVREDTEAYEYVCARQREDGEFAFLTVSGQYELSENPAWYAFYPQELNALLTQEFSNGFENLFVAAMSHNVDLDCVVVESGGEWYYIPYASVPEFLGVDNGRVYTSEEMAQHLEQYLAETADPVEETEGGGSGSSYVERGFILAICAATLVLGLAGVAAVVRRKR